MILLSIGHGYSAQALARRIAPARVIGTSRSAKKAGAFGGLVWPGQDLPIEEATHLLCSVAPDAAGDPVLRAFGERIAARNWDWIGYLSTVGVYGDTGGAWVDEDSPTDPGTQRGQERLAAEAEWRALGAHVFRLAGIYGPGRGPFEKVRSGQARRIVKPGQVFSRIHVEDIAQVLAASMARPDPGRVYNVCDDEPAPPQDVLAHAADLLGLPRPPEVAFDEAEMSPMARSFYAANRRVRNDRIKTELGVRLLYPDYRAGLALG
ncbi:SDR family oxidoreductase [Paenirhodobacter sp.]|uniref:SDR family oxidoreductase n=1 Tax=Paenirhodobacter sp. TaxID=1965326 RepID=UPI003B3D6BDE